MEQTGIRATVALQRMWLYATKNTVDEREDMQANLLNGHTVTYRAYDRTGEYIGTGTLVPEQFPVATVTETHTDA